MIIIIITTQLLAAAGSRYHLFSVAVNSQLQILCVKMADRLLKQNQSNFLLSNFREFYKLWRDNQEAILRVKCCEGKLSISFESSFKSPETKPTLPPKVNEKAKKISPSRQRRNQARAELFRSKKKEASKASEDNAERVPVSSREGQEATEVSVVSQTSSALDKPDASTAVPDDADEFVRNMQWLSKEDPALYIQMFNQLSENAPQEQAKKKDDAENLPPVSRVKNKTKSKDAAVNEEPAANKDETPELSDRLKTSVLDFLRQEGGEAFRAREEIGDELNSNDWLEDLRL